MFSQDTRNLLTGRFFILLTGILWSLAGVFIKSLELHPLVITIYRSFFASLFFLIFAPRRGWSFSLPLAVSVMSYTAAVSSFVWANKLTTAANAIVLQYTAPIFVFIFIRAFFRESISKENLGALVGGMVGVVIIFAGSVGKPDLVGVAIALLSGLLFSIFMVNLRFVSSVPAEALTFLNNLVCWIVLLPLVGADLAISMYQAIALAVMGIVQLGVPYFLFSKGLEKVPLQEASLIVLIEPVLNPLWVAMVIGEVPSRATLAGGAVILLSLAWRYTPWKNHRAYESENK